ncbi:hypothetical protein [Rhodococcus sp. ABRD24]|nr:hypothetical protein [Rhodococcus sp. ABRD24]
MGSSEIISLLNTVVSLVSALNKLSTASSSGAGAEGSLDTASLTSMS